jgi:hypothetical protein
MDISGWTVGLVVLFSGLTIGTFAVSSLQSLPDFTNFSYNNFLNVEASRILINNTIEESLFQLYLE